MFAILAASLRSYFQVTGEEIERYFQACGIRPQSATLRGMPVVMLVFPQNPTLQAILKHSGCRWSNTLKAWIAPREKAVLVKLVRAVGAACGVDTNRPELQALRRMSRLKGFSAKTETNYASAFGQALDFFYPRPPEAWTKTEIEDYLLYLSGVRGLGESAIHTAVNAVKFYLEAALGKSRTVYAIQRPKKALKIVAVFSKEEVKAILQAVSNPKHRAMLVLCYSCGLRVSEVVNLKIADVDSKRMVLYIRAAKGKKDRVVPLSPTALAHLREWYRLQPVHRAYLFSGADGRGPYSVRSLQQVLVAAKQRQA